MEVEEGGDEVVLERRKGFVCFENSLVTPFPLRGHFWPLKTKFWVFFRQFRRVILNDFRWSHDSFINLLILQSKLQFIKRILKNFWNGTVGAQKGLFISRWIHRSFFGKRHYFLCLRLWLWRGVFLSPTLEGQKWLSSHFLKQIFRKLAHFFNCD